MAGDESTTRADEVRSRRDKRSRRAKTRPVIPAAPPPGKSAQGAPVLMRGVRVDLPVKTRKAVRMRRRYDISLRSPGVELRLPTMPLVRPTWRWLSGLMTACLVGLIGMMWNYPLFLVEAIEVHGLQRLEAREVNLVLGIQHFPIFVLDPAELKYVLGEAFPEFSSIEVGIGLPNAVYITVEERQPVLGWLNPQGMVLLDAGGISFPARGLVNDQGIDSSAGGQQLPVISAPNMVMAIDPVEEASAVVNPYVGRQILTPAQVQAVLQVSAAAPAGATVIFDPVHGMGWDDPAGWVVYFGPDGTNMPERLQMYTSIVEDLQAQHVKPALISIEHLHAPYYRMER